MLIKELDLVKRSHAKKDHDIAERFEQHRQNQEDIRGLRHIDAASDVLIYRIDKSKLSRQGIEELKGRLRQQREEEDAEEALREKIRRHKIDSLHIARASEEYKAQSWWARWRGEKWFDELTADEQLRVERWWTIGG